MTLTAIKQLSIREYLNRLGIHPAKDYGSLCTTARIEKTATQVSKSIIVRTCGTISEQVRVDQ